MATDPQQLAPDPVDEEAEKEQLRFFTAVNQKKKQDEGDLPYGGANEDQRRNVPGDGDYYDEEDDDELGEGRCLTLRVLQKALPCFKKKSIWEASQGDVYKTQEVEETKYPLVLKILESKVLDVVFVTSCLASIYLFLFSEGFIIESKIIWGVIHFINAIYIFCLFGQWLQILVKTRYSKTNRGYTKLDVVFTLLCIFPADLIVLAIYTLTDSGVETDSESSAPGDFDHDHSHEYLLYITLSRLSYLLRIFSVLKYFSNWENQLAVGDFFMFIIRIGLYVVFFIHLLACVWHRIACEPFLLEHFKLTPAEATAEVCSNQSWIHILLDNESTLLDHPELNNVLLIHYLVSVYWAVTTAFRLGYGDIKIYLTSNAEVVFTCVAQIAAWILTMATVSGTLTSLLIESDTERENFLTRRAAIKYYLNFSFVPKSIVREVTNYYDHLWLRRKGILHLSLIEKMPLSLKSDVFFDINKDVFEKLPLLKDIDDAFVMNLAVHMVHTFYLEGEVLFKRNEVGNCMYYVLKGYLEVMSVDESQAITNIHSQSVIGEIFLVNPYPHIATVRCGSDCELVVLTREKFRQAVSLYPQFEDIFRKRAETRLYESAFFLNLCDKHNEYVQAFTNLHEHNKLLDLETATISPLIDFPAVEVELDVSNPIAKSKLETGGDIDELSIGSSILRRFSVAVAMEKEKGKEALRHARRISLLEAAFSALESDVNRAGTLARDLGIPIPPLVVSAPIDSKRKDKTVISTGQTVVERTSTKVIKIIRGSSESVQHLVWKSIISICVLISFWYYLHEWGFNREDTRKWNYIAHAMDVLIAIDFVFDMLQIVVISPHHTLQKTGDILAYRLCTLEFYLRLFGFLPWEYLVRLIIPSLGDTFYLLKMNRCLGLIVVTRYFQKIEEFARTPIVVFLFKFSLISLYVIHFYAVSYAVIQKNVLKTPLGSYTEALYWSTQIITSTGFGDMPYSSDEEVFVLTIGLIIGTGVLTYLGAKIAAILANSERRRVSFQQKYYAVRRFMSARHFPRPLVERVCRYYDIQWKTHEGVLIPTERTAIWDAPDTIIERVAMAQCQKHTARSPLIRFASAERQKAFCKLLRQYFVPPDEIILYPGDRRRELYIIIRGYCQVFSGKTLIGTLSEGHFLGLAGLIHGMNRNYTIKTATHCQFFCLLFDDFVNLARKSSILLREFKALRGEVILKHSFHPNTSSDKNVKTEMESAEVAEVKPENVEIGNTSGLNSLNHQLRSHPSQNRCSTKTCNPYGIPLRVWATFRTCAAVLVAMYASAQACFAFHPLASLLVILTFDIIAWIDIVIMFRRGYYGSYRQLIMNPKMAFWHYFKGAFFLDVLACIPFEYCLLFRLNPGELSDSNDNYGGSNTLFLMSFLRLNRVVQCYRLFSAKNFLEHNIYHSLSLITLIEVVPTMYLFIHVMACVSILLVCDWSGQTGDKEIHLNCEVSSWINKFKPFNPLVNATLDIDESKWLPKPEYKLTPYAMYTIAIYWVTQLSVSVGFGDIQILGQGKYIAIFIILSGSIFSQYLGSKLTACLVGEDARRILLRHQMSVMFNFLTQFKVSKSIQRRAQQVYFNAWDRTKGISPSELFAALHPTLKADVTKQLYEEKLRQSPLLKDLDDPGIRLLSSKLQEKFYPEGEYIIRFGDLNDDIFIVSTGIISAYSSHGELIGNMGVGSLIGEISALFEIERLYSVKAATDVDMFKINRSHFMDFLSMYPELKSTLEIACLNHLRDTIYRTKSIEFKLPAILEGGEFDSGLVHQWNIYKDLKTSSKDNIPLEQHHNENKSIPDLIKNRGSHHESLVAELNENQFQNGPTEIDPSQIEEGASTTNLDPLRVGVKDNSSNGNRHMKDSFSFLISFGSCGRQEMKLLHIVQEYVSSQKYQNLRTRMGKIKKDVTLWNFAIHPSSPICSSSISVCLFLLITCASCSIISFELAFTTEKGGETELRILEIIRWCLEPFFWIRFFGNLFVAYYDDLSGMLVSDRCSIFKRYVCSWYGAILLFEFITVFPMDEFVVLFERYVDHIALVKSHVRSIKLLRVVLFVKYLNDAESDLRMKASNMKIVKISIIFCFIFHFCACAWYIVACYGSLCLPDSWVERTVAKLVKGEPKLINDRKDITIGMWYFFSLFYVTTAVTFTGLDNVEPATIQEIWMTIFFIFATIFIIGYLIGEMTQCLASQVNHKIHYQHELVVLEEHFRSLGLPKSRCNDVHEYYKMLYQKCKGMSYFRLLQDLPYPLRADIGFEIFGPNVKSSRLLHRMDEYILRQLCARIKFEVYLPGTHIIHNGDVCEAMYFIKRGEIVILEQNQNLELCVEILYENECFGEVKLLLPQEQYHFSYISRLESELGVLTRKDLDEVIDNYPLLQADLRERARKIKFHRLNLQQEEELANKIDLIGSQTDATATDTGASVEDLKKDKSIY